MNLELSAYLMTGSVGGLGASVVLFIVVVGSYIFDKEVHLPEISGGQAKAPTTFRAYFWVTSILLAFLAGSVCSAWWVASLEGSFWDMLLAAYIAQLVLNLFDLVIIDIVLYQWINPSWMQFDDYPPIEGHAHHVRGFLKGLYVTLPFAVIGALLGLLA